MTKHSAHSVLAMGLLGNLIASNVDGVVIELDKEKTPYLVGEKVLIRNKIVK